MRLLLASSGSGVSTAPSSVRREYAQNFTSSNGWPTTLPNNAARWTSCRDLETAGVASPELLWADSARDCCPIRDFLPFFKFLCNGDAEESDIERAGTENHQGALSYGNLASASYIMHLAGHH